MSSHQAIDIRTNKSDSRRTLMSIVPKHVFFLGKSVGIIIASDFLKESWSFLMWPF